MDLESCPLAHGDNANRLCAWCGDPLPAKRRRWCSDACGGAWAINHHWTTARQHALDREGYACQRCATARPLLRPEVHHIQPVLHRGGYGSGCQHHQTNLMVLCPEHHRDEDGFRRRAERIVAASGRVILAEQLAFPIAA